MLREEKFQKNTWKDQNIVEVDCGSIVRWFNNFTGNSYIIHADEIDYITYQGIVDGQESFLQGRAAIQNFCILWEELQTINETGNGIFCSGRSPIIYPIGRLYQTINLVSENDVPNNGFVFFIKSVTSITKVFQSNISNRFTFRQIKMLNIMHFSASNPISVIEAH